MNKAKLSNEDIGALALALHHLIHSGIAPGDAFALMAEDEPRGDYREMLLSLSRSADEGRSLAETISESERFPGHVCALIAVGERVGKTEETLLSLAKYYDNLAQMERQLKNSLMYPMALMLVMVLVVAAMLIFVMPVFGDVYASLGGNLTGTAALLLAVGNALRFSLPVLCVIMLCAAVFALVLASSAPARDKILRIYRNSRGDKGVWAQVNEANFAQALSMGLESGLAEAEAVSLAAAVAAGCPDFEKRCQKCLEYVDKGESLVHSLRESGLLSGKDCRLLEAGKRSGSGERVMAEIADSLNRESSDALERSLMRIEPAMVLIMSVVVGAILLSVMLPLINIMNAIG